MRTLVISDVHGNLAALEAVLAAEPWDELVCLGDLVGYGPEPAGCVEHVQRHADVVVQGNHDRSLAAGHSPRRWVSRMDALVPSTAYVVLFLHTRRLTPLWSPTRSATLPRSRASPWSTGSRQRPGAERARAVLLRDG